MTVMLGTEAPTFDLPGVDGERHRIEDYADAPLLALVQSCNHCPYVQAWEGRMMAIQTGYEDRGFRLVAINSNDAERYPADSPEAMRREKEAAGYPFPYLYDETQEVAKAYRAACTPDFFLFDAGHRLVYRGQFDDSRPMNGVPAAERDLRAALDAVLEGRPVSAAQKPSLGCNIKWRPGAEPDYFG